MFIGPLFLWGLRQEQRTTNQQKTAESLLRLRRFAIRRNDAESEGFEPPEPCGSTVFKTAAIDHSANFPSAKVTPFFHSAKS